MGVKKNKTWIKNGIIYLKSLYLTLSADKKQPAPVNGSKVNNSTRGKTKMVAKI